MIARFSDRAIDLRRLEIRAGNEVVAAEPQVFDVLSYLLEHRDRLVTKEELLDNVWGDRFVSESALTSRIKSARKALGDNGRDQAVIRTVHGRGYQFVADIDIDDGTEPAPAHANASAPEPTAAPTADVPDLDDSWPLVGRHDEIDELTRMMQQGERNGVLLTGPAAIGKTRLARVCIDRARGMGIATAHVSGSPTAQQIPLAALAHLLPPEILEAGAAPGDLARTVVFQRARSALHDLAAGARLAVLVDNADHLDELSNALISSLIASGSVFAVLTQRTTSGQPLAFDELVRNGQVAHLELGPLDDTDLDVLLYRVLDGPIDLDSLQQLTSLSRGRPGALQQLVETCRATQALDPEGGVWRLVGPIQATVGVPGDQVILESLPPAALAGAEILAIAQDLDLDFATRLIGADELDTLDRSGLLALDDATAAPRVSIVHAHIGILLAERLGPLRARRHRARLISEMDPDLSTDVDRMRRIGWMLENGDEPDIDEALRAAQTGVAAADSTVCELILEHLAGTAAANEAMQLRGELHFHRGQMNLAEELLARVDLDHLDGITAATVVRRRATLEFHARGRFNEALDRLGEAASRFDGAARDMVVAHAIGLRGFLGYAEPILAMVDDIGSDLAIGPQLEVLRGSAQAHVARGAFDDAIEVLDRHDEQARHLPPVAARASREVSLATRIAALTSSGQLPAASAVVRRQLPVGQRTMLAWLPMAAARAEMMAGRSRLARELISTPLAAVRSQNLLHAEPQMLGVLSQTSVRVGFPDDARKVIEECRPSIDYLIGQMAWSLLVSMADVAARTGIDGDLIRPLLSAADDAHAVGAHLYEAELLMAATKISPDTSVVERLEGVVAKVEGPLWEHRAAHARALVEQDSSALAEVEAAYRELGYDGYADGVASSLTGS